MSTTPGSRRNKYQIQFQPLMNDCRDMVLVYTNALMTELFNKSDDALLDFARKAENNEMQNRFFEAMQEIKDQQSSIEHSFRKNITDKFNNFWAIHGGKSGAADEFFDSENLELVKATEMDESVASQNMIGRAENDNMPQIYALCQRLAVINGGEIVTKEQLPAGPNHLVLAFQDAISVLTIETKIKLIILALFNRCILKQVGSLYEDFNNVLKEAGVLPHLKPALVKSASAESIPSKKSEAFQERVETPEQLGEELFNSIISLMGTRRKKSPATHAGSQTGTAGAPVQRAAPKELVSALNEIQPKAKTNYVPAVTEDFQFIPNIEIDEQFLERIKTTLFEERDSLYKKVGKERMDSLDEDTIDLVGMLFEYMLNDPVLPNVAKALISHLHTPYLKVAIIDRSLLSNTQHVARRLLDCLVEAGCHWVDESNLKRGIYPDMQQVVDRILKEFTTNDLTVFQSLFSTFKERMAKFRQKTDILERRAKEAAEGREKLNVAKQRAKQEMKARLHATKLPAIISEFLLQSWADKLIFTLLRHPEGELSEDWKDALRIADDLVWVFEPKTTDADKRELEKMLPALREAIQGGLSSLGGYNMEQGEEIFDLLESPEKIYASVDQPTTATGEPKSGGQPAKARHVGDKITEQSTSESEQEAEIPEEEQAMMDKIAKIKYGTWFEVYGSSPDDVKKVKLSWLSPLTSTCMFVDRAGVQTAIKPVRLLAQEMLEGKSRVIEESNDPFVERTLHAIKRMLTHSVSTTDKRDEQDNT